MLPGSAAGSSSCWASARLESADGLSPQQLLLALSPAVLVLLLVLLALLPLQVEQSQLLQLLECLPGLLLLLLLLLLLRPPWSCNALGSQQKQGCGPCSLCTTETIEQEAARQGSQQHCQLHLQPTRNRLQHDRTCKANICAPGSQLASWCAISGILQQRGCSCL